MKLYKGFDKNMQCRGFQFEEGKTYIHDGKIKLCKQGFHACENPLDCFNYYSTAESIYREVEMEDVSDERKEDSKVAGKSIKIGARISFGKIAQLAVEYINSHIDKSKKQQVRNTGNRSADSNTGDYSAASNTGYYSAAEVSGKQSVALAIGKESRVRGALGCWIVCAEWDENGIKDVQCVCVDGEKIKPDVWYALKNSAFVEE